MSTGTPYRLSPMTAYYLRKFIQSKQAELTWKSSDLKHPVSLDSFFSQVINGGPDSYIPLDVLERFVTLHKSLLMTYKADSPQVLDIESQIYESLGMEQIKSSQLENENSTKENELSIHRYQDLLKQLNELRCKSEILLGPQTTLTYLLESRPDDSWCQLFKIPENGKISYYGGKKEYITNTRLKTFETWTQNFIQKCSSITPKLPEGEVSTNEPLINTPLNIEPLITETTITETKTTELQANPVIDTEWVELRRSARLSLSESNAQPPKRCIDLLKQLNTLRQKSASVLGPKTTFTFLLESRPDHDWCKNFNISETGRIAYTGNIREIITTTRLKVYGFWATNFIQKCESYIPVFEQE